MILGYLAVLTLCFTITDPSAILNTPTKYPFIQLFYNITNSYVGTDIMVAIIVIALVCAVIAEIATASRQIWSFARDGGLPFSPFLSKVRMPSSAFPVSNQLSSYCHLHLLDPINLRHKTPSTEARSNTRGYDSVGLPKLPHPPQRSHSLLPLRRRHQPNQPRFRRRSQRHHLPHHLRPPSLLRALHRLHSLQASTPRTAATGTLVLGPCWNGGQYHRARLFGAFLCVLLLPDCDAGPAGYDELEYRYVRGDLFVGYGLLCAEGKEDVYSAGEDCEAGYLVGRMESYRLKGFGREMTTALNTRSMSLR